MARSAGDLRHALRFAGNVLLTLSVCIGLIWGAFVISSKITGSKLLATLGLIVCFAILALTSEKWIGLMKAFLF
jgi:hypothetical protein